MEKWLKTSKNKEKIISARCKKTNPNDATGRKTSWKHHTEHTQARNRGRSEWYLSFKVRIARVERNYEY